MALHVQMSEKAGREYKRNKVRSMLSSFGSALGLSLTFALTLTFTVIVFSNDPPAEFLAYVPPAENLAHPQPTTRQFSSRPAASSEAVAPVMIFSISSAPVVMAQLDIELDAGDDEGISVDMNLGLEVGLGDAIGEGGDGLGSTQGGGSALTGTLYDLKQTRSGAPTRVAPGGNVNKNELYATVGGYLKTWSQSSLARYYKSPTRLYASNFFVPMAMASLAPEAFQCQQKVKPAAWLVVYRGKVKSPITGKIRFVGTGDDFIGVRFGDRTVLEGGYRMPSAYQKNDLSKVHISGGDHARYKARIRSGEDRAHRNYEFIEYPGIPTWNKEIGGLTAGDPISVKEGAVYPIEIAVTEEGGAFGYVLMWESLTDAPVVKNGKVQGGRKFYLFRTNFSEPKPEELQKLIGKHKRSGKLEWPEYEADCPIWVAVP